MKERIKSIDSLRVVMCICVIYFHILHSSIMKYTGGSEIYLKLHDLCANSTTRVDCFLIISGFFLYKAVVGKKYVTISQYIADRFLRLWPVYFFFLLMCVLCYHYGIYNVIIQSFMLHGTAISLSWGGVTWIPAPLFWVSIFLFSLARCIKCGKSNILIAVLVYFSYAIIINTGHGDFDSRKTIYNFLSLGMLRVLGDVGLGYLFAVVTANLPSIKKSYISCIIFTMTEIFSVTILGINWFYKPMAYNNQIIVILMFMLLFMCMYLGNGLIAKLFDNKGIAFLGKYTYSIYIMQQIGFWILHKTLWKRTLFLQHHWCATMIISIVTCIVVGVIVYYLVERPAIDFYKSKTQNQ